MKKISFYLVFLVLLVALLPACGSKIKSDELLAEKGILVSNLDSESKNNTEEIDKLALFWTNLPTVENEVTYEIREGLSFDDYFDMLLHAFNQSNYGNTFGLTYYICKQNELCDLEELSLCEIMDDELYILDLSEPLFDEKITDYETIEKVKAISVDFSEYVSKQYGIEKLVEISVSPDSEEVAKLKNEWLKTVGYDYKYEACSKTFIIRNDEDDFEEYPYCAEGVSYKVYFSLEDIKKQGYKDYFGEFSRIESMIDEDFYDAREAFWKCNGDVEPVKIYTCFTKDNSYKYVELGGAYYHDENLVRVYVDWKTAELVLVHEYIHYLDKDFINEPEIEMVKKRSLYEAYPVEISTYECINRLMKDGMMQYFGLDRLKEIGVVTNDEVDLRLVTELVVKEYLEEKEDEIISATGSKYTVKGDIIPWDYLPNTVNGSFFHFLMEKYGKEKIIELTYRTKSFDEFVSTDYDKLYHEWVSYVMANEYN